MNRRERRDAMLAWREIPRSERHSTMQAGRRGDPLPDPARGLTLVRWADAALHETVPRLLWLIACLAVVVVGMVNRGGTPSPVRLLILAWFAFALFSRCSAWYFAAGVARHRASYEEPVPAAAE